MVMLLAPGGRGLFHILLLPLNYYFDGLNVFWYHVVNFFIHYVTSVFLFLFIYNTLKLPILEGRYERNAYSIALLSTLFWAINPVEVMAVTYIVQRMASMTAMFYIMAMYFYLKGRTGDTIMEERHFLCLSRFFGLIVCRFQGECGHAAREPFPF